MYCIKIGRTEPEFWESTHKKVNAVINMYVDEMNMKAAAMDGVEYHSQYFEHEPEIISSMKEVEGFVNG